MQALIRSNRLAKALVAVFVLALAVGIPTIILAQGTPPPPRIPPPPIGSVPIGDLPPPPPPFVVDPKKLEDAVRLIKSGAVATVDIGDGYVVTAMAGIATRGSTIKVAGVTIKLPNDAYIEGNYMESYGIARGEGIAFVFKKTGEFQIAKGAPGLFDFLANALGPEKERPFWLSSR